MFGAESLIIICKVEIFSDCTAEWYLERSLSTSSYHIDGMHTLYFCVPDVSSHHYEVWDMFAIVNGFANWR